MSSFSPSTLTVPGQRTLYCKLDSRLTARRENYPWFSSQLAVTRKKTGPQRPWDLQGAWAPLPAVRVFLWVFVHHIDDVQHHQPHAQNLLLFHEAAPQASNQQAEGIPAGLCLLSKEDSVPTSQGLTWLLLCVRSSSRREPSAVARVWLPSPANGRPSHFSASAVKAKAH